MANACGVFWVTMLTSLHLHELLGSLGAGLSCFGWNNLHSMDSTMSQPHMWPTPSATSGPACVTLWCPSINATYSSHSGGPHQAFLKGPRLVNKPFLSRGREDNSKPTPNSCLCFGCQLVCRAGMAFISLISLGTATVSCLPSWSAKLILS